MEALDIRIREATPDDFADVAEMHYPVWRRSWDGILTPPLLDILGPPKRWVAEIYPHTLNRDGWRMWVAESGGRTLGVAIFGPDPDERGAVQIDALYIADESQRHGIGRRLLDEILSAHPSGDVILWAAVRNDKARRFYEKNNFRVDGRTLDWEPLPGIKVAHVGYRLTRR
ncbi:MULTISPECIES: GNAT family N-acetyltransferase [unclassified Mycobacterium]|uniref:GNAT family N-acetyltransferase n=1 Tax=unclassified Mycobacterium TaxID=2642494 RepID=UPI0007FF9C2D|nr:MULTISPECIES: GNAT family N-acetyltransferase [unclassified Mycobacterium]OBI11446.1 GNAT family acetyltransferase [Mycobacterium sp. E2327]OBI60137.1 GNAT family acetyltransferase [Mycobacterium sp. E796]